MTSPADTPAGPTLQPRSRLSRLNQSASLQLLIGSGTSLAGLLPYWRWLALPAALVNIALALA